MKMNKQLRELEEKLERYKKIFLEKKRMFRGIRHEDSLSELRYTQFMVYKNLVEGLSREVAALKQKVRDGSD